MMSLASFKTAFSILLLLLFCHSGHSSAKSCDLVDPDDIIYTPFTPYFVKRAKDTYGTNATLANGYSCWWWADCAISRSMNVRQQQFAATSLVMGLLPLVLKDIAWPERRIAYISTPLGWFREILVRALGLVPVLVTSDRHVAHARRLAGEQIPSLWKRRLITPALFILLLIGYGAIALVEIFSKRSSLGCPFPIFVLSWHIIALLPATIQVTVLRNTRAKGPGNSRDESPDNGDPGGKISVSVDAVQGGEAPWWVQFIWAIYYTAGTLIFTSIMVVTVIELFTWVMVACATTAFSKLVAYRLCGHWKFR